MCDDSISNSIKNKVDMRMLLDKLGIQPSRGNNCYNCMFHDDKNPSAGITKDGGYFHCFACGITASVIDVVMKLKNLDYLSACKYIDDEFNLGIFGEISSTDKIKIRLAEEQRIKDKAYKERIVAIRKQVLKQIGNETEIWKSVQKDSHITKGEYKNGDWKYGDIFFYAIQRQIWLDWLYDVILEIPHKECIYDYTIGTNAEEILLKIEKGEISI